MNRRPPYCDLPMAGAAALTALLSLTLMGCGGAANSDALQKQTSHLRTLVTLYNTAGRTLGHSPKNEQEFREYIQANGQAALKKMNIPSVDDLFISQRDGQPLVVFYGKRPEGVRQDVVAYEQKGVDGKREVGFDLGMIQEMDEAEFRKIVPTDPAAGA